MSPPELPSKLVTVPWSEGLNVEAYSRRPEPSPGPFALTVPHAIIRNTHLYNQLRYAKELDNRSLKDVIGPLCEEIAQYQKQDSNEMYGLSKTIVIKYGETSLRVIRRMWDLSLVYNSRPEIPGDIPLVFAQGTWSGTLCDTVLYRMHYAEDFKIANHNQFMNGAYITNVLTQDHRDRVERAAEEREVLSAVWQEVTGNSKPKFSISTSLGMTKESALELCIETVETFHETLDRISDDKEYELHKGDTEEIHHHQARQLLHIAARAAANWESRQPGSSDNILSVYCEDMLRRRRNEIRKQNAELRQQLEAILGDTRGGQVGMGSDGESEYDSDDESEESDDSDLPMFDHYDN
ncbi:hypothetical protein FOPG_03044 [Fusarium oxysporum f. sp. conglutinans race 2 54008]|uniref:Uncharacterized protein n=3 Tax=Fusarium oxysporum f. sp. conglutinans TaxID=100902 RepID=A0A8H6GF84_FUSOX|nr:hypothetical protein FOXB_06610 [Fusarium oxysporum f. sp. conglutinans Fo5176]EXL85130.1 hypothetical protein FOPG_03044 [Fusarium oxysporum f. sp. conglutinans race 2 54008]KAF6516475.1 hypothetical protein HZS61_003678 [Fusarium oxysporum f. sp. conglutinans]KAG6982579.1 hypothetical protein FocnCong_v006657 [Fusarium oxysporum f. sp. conglutinans]KAI8403057.1 hypothetical protein FOFC_16490 [Fusarium oxysporum]